MLLRFTEMCSARIEGVQDSQSCDLMMATCIVVMIVEGGQVGGGLAFFVVMITPLGLFITPEKHQSPQAASAIHAKNAALLSNRFWECKEGIAWSCSKARNFNHARNVAQPWILCL